MPLGNLDQGKNKRPEEEQVNLIWGCTVPLKSNTQPPTRRLQNYFIDCQLATMTYLTES